jgi:hypothetical protein
MVAKGITGIVEVSERRDRAIAFVSVDMPLHGRTDGKAEAGFVLQELSAGIGITHGRGTVSYERGLLRIQIEGVDPVLVATDEARSSGRRSLDGAGRLIKAGIIRPYLSPSGDPSIPNGSPGTGIITHKAQAEYLLKVIP